MLTEPAVIEPRNTITRGWRPKNAPTRHLDDFQEVRHQPASAQAQPIQVIERRSIGRRLENWGMWANMGSRSGSRGGDCMTGVICDSMRRNAIGELHAAAPVNDRVDVPDAEQLNAGIPKIEEAHRWVLHWTYVVCAKPWGVAGACGFPTREYGLRLLAAQQAIEACIGGIGKQRA